MEVNENAIVLGEVTPDMTRFLMHGCYDVGAICDAHGNTQTFDANDPCFLLAVGDDEFAVVSRSGYHDPRKSSCSTSTEKIPNGSVTRGE